MTALYLLDIGAAVGAVWGGAAAARWARQAGRPWWDAGIEALAIGALGAILGGFVAWAISTALRIS